MFGHDFIEFLLNIIFDYTYLDKNNKKRAILWEKSNDVFMQQVYNFLAI